MMKRILVGDISWNFKDHYHIGSLFIGDQD
jgi:hypothetical protein